MASIDRERLSNYSATQLQPLADSSCTASSILEICVVDVRVAKEVNMAEKGSVSLPSWQLAWLKRHESELMRRMSTRGIVDCLTAKDWIKPTMDVYQTIQSQMTIPNQRARLLLKFIRSSTSECFWDFITALAETGCVDLALSRDDEQAVVETFTDEELTAAFYLLWQEGRPASVVKVNKQLKELYRGSKRRALAGVAGSKPVSLDDIRVNICLLSADKLSALCGSPGQYEPLSVSRFRKEQVSSVVELEGIFEDEEDNRIQASGIAGSGKSTAFMEKAPHEWAKVILPRGRGRLWPHISLFFRGSLTNQNWWKAQDLVEIFGLARFNLTREEEGEVVRYIKSHSQQVLLVADALGRGQRCRRIASVGNLDGKVRRPSTYETDRSFAAL